MHDGPRIRVLSSVLADQIAAGEVVERPASVVKELCENAIDAGASRIEVDIEEGGRRLIRVVDDGGGMTDAEARLAMLRHATSKIIAAEDLWGLRTFGFRGEALPSIAAVSRMNLRTRRTGAVAGFQILFEAGVEISTGEVGMPEGTHIEVRDLFFNTPARLKFLKSENTESAAIAEAILRLSIPNPNVHFRYRNGSRQVLDLPIHRDLPERVRAALAKRGAGLLHEARGQEAGVDVRAFLAPPEDASNTPRSTLLFVGRRFVRDRSLLHSLCMGYGESLEKGRYPMAVLFVDVPGEDLDINVHPQKLEVRFSRPQEVYGAVRHIIGAAVSKAPWFQSDEYAYTQSPALTNSCEPRAADGNATDSMPSPGRFHSTPSTGARGVRSVFDSKREELFQMPPRALPSVISEFKGDDQSAFFSRITHLGTLKNAYLICELEGDLVVFDQHAAHERILLKKLQADWALGSMPKHRLLFPIPIEVPDEGVELLANPDDLFSSLARLGFEGEIFGERTLLLRAVPESLRDSDPKPLLLDVIVRLARCPVKRMLETDDGDLLATIACHGAVHTGDHLSPVQVRSILAQLDEADMTFACTQGRSVAFRIPLHEIERHLGKS